MEATRHFEVAPWPRALKFISTLGTLLLIGGGIVAYRAIPVPAGFTHYFGLGVAFLLPVILVFCILYAVTGYTVSPDALVVQRLLWGTRISLARLQRATVDPTVCKGSLRVFGNGGLFSFTGIYYNRRLGRYRLYATDFARSVVLVIDGRSVVITPAAAEAFVEHIHHIFPATRVNQESHTSG